MWCRSYRDHAIMAFPSFDTISKSWACQANITWITGSSRESAFVRFACRAATESEAVALALASAQDWIDHRLKEVSSWRMPKPAAVEVAAAGGGESRRQTKVKRSARTMTFDQFRRLMMESGHQGSERSLQKSYAALLELRRQGHRSWTEITLKIRRPQTSLPDRPGGGHSSRLPLTPKDWRRIV